MSKITKYNRVPLGFDLSVARLLGLDPTPDQLVRPLLKVTKSELLNLHVVRVLNFTVVTKHTPHVILPSEHTELPLIIMNIK